LEVCGARRNRDRFRHVFIRTQFVSDLKGWMLGLPQPPVTSNLAIGSQLAHHGQGGRSTALREQNEHKFLVLYILTSKLFAI